MDNIRKSIGGRIRQVRKLLGMNQKALGDLLGLGVSAVSAYETGDSAPAPEALLKIAEAANVTLDWLLTGQEKNGASYNAQADDTPRFRETVAVFGEKSVSITLEELSIVIKMRELDPEAKDKLRRAIDNEWILKKAETKVFPDAQQ